MLRGLRDRLASEISAILIERNYERRDTTNLIEINKYGDGIKGLLATPIAYRLASNQNRSPATIADDLADALWDQGFVEGIESIDTVDGYINFHIAEDEFTTQILEQILETESEYGVVEDTAIPAVFDFASPNLGKPLHIGHLRNTVLGDVLGNILETQGYDLVRINRLGDWGVQFSHLLYEFEVSEDKERFEDDPIGYLLELYQRYGHREVELENAECVNELEQLRNTGREYFSRLEHGDETLRTLWKRFLTESRDQFETTYDRLGVTFDIWTAESSSVTENWIDQIWDKAQKRNITVETANGAYIIPIYPSDIRDVGEFEQDKRTEYTKFVLVKDDGTTTYGMRDLATIAYRVSELGCTEVFYVVGDDHHEYFQQLFAAARKLGYTDVQFTHIDYGLVDLPEGPMSTREGRFVTVTEVIDQVYEKAFASVQENNPTLKEERIAEIAEGITIGTIRFYAMFRHRKKKMTFNIEQATSLKGDTGAYIQYAATRGLNILHKANCKIPEPTAVANQPFNKYDHQLAICLAWYPLALEHCTQRYDTTPLAQYLLNLTRTFNTFYTENHVLDSEQARERRLVLVAATIQVFENVFEISGIPLLQQM